jgi:hypothetical protein
MKCFSLLLSAIVVAATSAKAPIHVPPNGAIPGEYTVIMDHNQPRIRNTMNNMIQRLQELSPNITILHKYAASRIVGFTFRLSTEADEFESVIDMIREDPHVQHLEQSFMMSLSGITTKSVQPVCETQSLDSSYLWHLNRIQEVDALGQSSFYIGSSFGHRKEDGDCVLCIYWILE